MLLGDRVVKNDNGGGFAKQWIERITRWKQKHIEGASRGCPTQLPEICHPSRSVSRRSSRRLLARLNDFNLRALRKVALRNRMLIQYECEFVLRIL